MIDLSVDISGLTLKNPIMTASGCCQYGLELSDFFPLDSIGAVVVKGLSLKPREGNPTPRIAETPAGMLNSIGLQNIGIDAFLKDKWPQLKEQRATVAANIFGEQPDHYPELARICSDAGIPAVELNLSCPNVQQGGLEFGVDPGLIEEITRSCREVYTGSLWVKLTPNVSRIAPLAEAARKGGADAVTCINTLRGAAIDIKTRKPRLRTVFGGLSGPAIKPVALRFVLETTRSVPIPVIACGGIMTCEDVIEFILAGATAVQVGTLLFRNPEAPQQLVTQLRRYLEEEGLDSVRALRGKVQIDG